jgi:hypothetical protein
VKSAHLKSQREPLSQLAQSLLWAAQHQSELQSHNHALQSSLQIAQSAQSDHFVQSV